MAWAIGIVTATVCVFLLWFSPLGYRVGIWGGAKDDGPES